MNKFYKATFPVKAILLFLLVSGQWGMLYAQQVPPVITSTAKTAAVENVAYSYPITASDANNDPLTFTAPTLPSWLTLVQGEGTASAFGTTVSAPGGIAGDDAGNIYVTTLQGTTINKISPAGVVSVFMTRATGLVYGMAINQGYLYIAYWDVGKVTRVDLNNVAAGEKLILTTPIQSPLSMVFRQGQMYIALYNANKIAKLNPGLEGQTYSTAMDVVTLNRPFGLGFNKAGDLYIAQYDQRQVSKLTGTTLTVALPTLSSSPSDIKIDENDYVYVSSTGFGVRKYAPDLLSFTTAYTSTNQIWGMSLTPTGALVFGDLNRNQVYKLETGAVLKGTPTHANVGDHPVVIQVTDGTANVQQAFTITVTDPNPPTVTTFSPLNNAIDVSLAQDLVLTFNETVVKGTGNIVIRNVTGDAIVETIAVNSTHVSIANDNVVTINPSADLPASGNYYVTVDAGALKDASANPYAGISAKTIFTFKTILNTAPVFTSTAITAASENVAYTYSVTATDADSDPLTFTATTKPAWLTLTQTGNVVTLTGTPAHANVGNNAVVLNVTDGKANVTQSFTVAVADVTAPTLTTVSPANNAVDVALAQEIVFTFSEGVVKGTGNFLIKKVADDAIVEIIAMSSANVTLANNVVTVNPAADLTAGGNYYVTIDATAIKDASANAYAGISSKTALTFRTIKAASVISLAANATATYGDVDFTPVFTSSNTATAVTFSSGNTAVATIVNNKVHILKAGTVAITAAQDGDLSYSAASPVTQQLVIAAKPITVSATAGQTKVYGAADPVFAYTSGALVSGDSFNGSLSRVAGENIGTTYAIGQGSLTAGSNYTVSYIGSNFSITPKAIAVTAVAKTKVYGETDPALTYTFAPALVAGDSFTGALGRVSGEAVNTYAINQGTLALSSNYALSYTPAVLTIGKKALVITADNKEKFAGTANPELTATFAGFVNNETRTILSAQPVIATTATTVSPVGNYSITAAGAAAANYSISYVNGTLTVKAAAPTTITLASVTLFENAAAGAAAGTLSSTAEDAATSFSYSLISGSGDTDNNLFRIAGTALQTTAALDYESKASYSIRVRSTTQYGFSLDRVFTIAVTDVNEVPTLAAIANQTICYTTTAQSVALAGITAGPESAQTVAMTLTSTNAGLFDALTVSKGNGTAGTLNYRLKSGVTGTATVTVTVRDNGGTANGSVDVTTRTFTITVNALPIVAISSNKGLILSKGETAVLTATGGVTYSWRNAAGVISGQNTASLTIRPDVTAMYEVTVTNASGCAEVQTITIEVLSDYIAVNATNIMSPNGDGKNDFFVVENIDKYPNNEVKIFDRGGRILFEKKNYDNSFDAVVNGSPLKEGTYYYIIDFGPGQLKKKGFITIIRDN